MDLQIKDQFFIVGGATSGLGRAIAFRLLQEGASVLGVARGADALREMEGLFTERFQLVAGDITDPATLQAIMAKVGIKQVHGVLVNAGGPPAKLIMETTPEDWDGAYYKLLRWKVSFVQALVPQMKNDGYGRFLFLESQSVKQPIENLVLSNSLRMAVVGFAKTLSLELAGTGITANIIGPGSHETAAIKRLYNKKSEQTGLSEDVIREAAISNIPVGALGQADDFAQLAAWLLSPGSRYVTGQVYFEMERVSEFYPQLIRLPEFGNFTWIQISLIEGKFHQVRKMVAALGHKCIRLIRISIEELSLGNLPPGQVLEMDELSFFSKLKLPYSER